MPVFCVNSQQCEISDFLIALNNAFADFIGDSDGALRQVKVFIELDQANDSQEEIN